MSKKDEYLEPGTYMFTTSDPFLKKLKKGKKFEVKTKLKYTDIVLGDKVFCVNIEGEDTCFTKDMIKKV